MDTSLVMDIAVESLRVTVLVDGWGLITGSLISTFAVG